MNDEHSLAGLKANYGRERRNLANIRDLLLLVFNASVAEYVSYGRELCARGGNFLLTAHRQLEILNFFSHF